MTESVNQSPINKLSINQKIFLVVTVAVLWCSTTAYETYLDWNLAKFRIEQQSQYDLNSRLVLEKLLQYISEAEQKEIKSLLGGIAIQK